MHDTVRKVYHFTILVPNKPGQAFGVLAALVSGGVNLLACAGAPRGRRAQIDVVPDDKRKFSRAVRKAGLEFTSTRSGFLIQGDDRPGALADNLGRLADKGINVVAVDGLSAGKGRWGAILWVAAPDMERARRALVAKS